MRAFEYSRNLILNNKYSWAIGLVQKTGLNYIDGEDSSLLSAGSESKKIL